MTLQRFVAFLLETFWTRYDIEEIMRWGMGTNHIGQAIKTFAASTPGEELEKGAFSQRTDYDAIFSHLSVINRLMAAHYRYDADRALEALEELIHVSETTHLPMQISHLGSCCSFGNMKEGLELIDDARHQGIDVQDDCYPYDAFSTTIGSPVFDPGCFERWKSSYGAILVAEGKYRTPSLMPLEK